jgi:hypothetical protein
LDQSFKRNFFDVGLVLEQLMAFMKRTVSSWEILFSAEVTHVNENMKLILAFNHQLICCIPSKQECNGLK